ncbi:MAG: hypothetical protein RLP44_05520 [Aggregatilineales bacterium]
MTTKDFRELDKIYLHDSGIISIQHSERDSPMIFKLNLIVDEETMELGHGEITFYDVKDVSSDPDLMKMSWRAISVSVAEVTYTQHSDRWEIKWYVSVYEGSQQPWSSVISFSTTSFNYVETKNN